MGSPGDKCSRRTESQGAVRLRARPGNRKDAGKLGQMSRGARGLGKVTEAARPECTELTGQWADLTFFLRAMNCWKPGSNQT